MPEWELKHKADIRPSFLRHYMREDREEIRTSWSLDRGKGGSDDRVDCGWDSSDDSAISVEGEDGIDNDYSHDDYHVGGEDGDLEEEEDEVDTDEDEDLEEDDVDTDEDEDFEEVEHEDFKVSEDDGDDDEDEEVDY
ncbi:acidic leucine-rich nuclear phosphoprotein 32 family member B-like [Panicum virgatum]|uniref:acidic leucine-rich nuclear phosphoprotein 32 family member B-like n=1 Tax=Panicum virgatum TaxID=38727 RepID=UPI0019D5E4E8|nr:acidic leucine-rich nuclear phosphoprotein 32 family member B-like [Panicum virgatum]